MSTPVKSTSTISVLLKTLVLHIPLSTFLTLNCPLFVDILKTSFSSLVMPSPFFPLFLNLPLNKQSIISILDTPLKSQELNLEWKSQPLLSLHASERPSFLSSLKFMLTFSSRRFTSMVLTSGLLTLGGLEENTESEKYSFIYLAY